jgi:hypothetical protein
MGGGLQSIPIVNAEPAAQFLKFSYLMRGVEAPLPRMLGPERHKDTLLFALVIFDPVRCR